MTQTRRLVILTRGEPSYYLIPGIKKNKHKRLKIIIYSFYLPSPAPFLISINGMCDGQ